MSSGESPRIIHSVLLYYLDCVLHTEHIRSQSWIEVPTSENELGHSYQFIMAVTSVLIVHLHWVSRELFSYIERMEDVTFSEVTERFDACNNLIVDR